MPCYHPLKAFPIGLTDKGKTKYKICPYAVDHVEIYRDGRVIPCSCHERSSYAERCIRDFVEIPCGKCIGCRLEYSRQWANRCMLEMEYHKSAYFVTLTYNDEHVPRVYYPDPDTGEAMKALSLRKRDLQLFMKRLRKSFPQCHIRFFAAGEYGSGTFRPHYHLILFGLELDDLQLYKTSPQGFRYYNSPSLQRCWSVFDDDRCVSPLGFAVVADVSWETCAYTARYVMKKLKGPEAQFYNDHNLEPPFTVMSRKPGIARLWYDDHPDCMEQAYINISTPTGGKKFRPPRYYDYLYDLDDPCAAKQRKENSRAMADYAKALKMAQTSLTYEEQLEVEERKKERAITKLERRLEDGKT